jgi:hypothetical protein
VGIGTTSADTKLHLYATGSGNVLDFKMSGSWSSGVYYRIIGFNEDKQIQFSYNDGMWLSDNNSIRFGCGGTKATSGVYSERMRITNGGNVGVGMVSPQDKLHTDIIRIGDWNGGGNGFRFSMDTNASLRIQYMSGQTVHSNIMSLKYDTGNVGIGVTSANTQLEVDGDIRVSGGTYSSYVQINNGGSIWRNYNGVSGAGLHFTGGAVIPADHNGGNHGGNNIDLGHTSYKWRNLYVHSQVNAAGSLYTGGSTQSSSYYITGAGTHLYNAGGLWGMRYNNPSYSWHRWNGAHHLDVFSNSSFTAGGVPLYLNYYSGAQVRLNNTHYASDDRIKTNERYITNATQTLLKLKPQIYDKAVNLGCESNETRVESGLIAQDVYYDTPELRHLVGYHDDAEIPDEKPYVDDDPQKDPDYSMWGSKSAAVDYVGLIAYLVKSNQEIYGELQITKDKAHNALQTVADMDTRLRDHENNVQALTTMLEEERQKFQDYVAKSPDEMIQTLYTRLAELEKRIA